MPKSGACLLIPNLNVEPGVEMFYFSKIDFIVGKFHNKLLAQDN